MENTPASTETVSDGGKNRKKRSPLGGGEIAQLAKEQIAALTGLDRGRVSGLGREGDGWLVTVDMVEVKFIPDSMDVMGAYEVQVDAEGSLVTYKRIRRYRRGEVTTES